VKILKQKNLQLLTDKVQYRQKIAVAGGQAAMAVGILLRSFQFLAERVRRSPPNSIRLRVPETLIFSFEASISYLYTNAKGFLAIRQLNGPDGADECPDGGRRHATREE